MRALLLILLCTTCLYGFADDKASASYRYVCGKEEKLISEAEEIAIQRAREKAIEDTYGVFIQRLEGMDISNGFSNYVSQSTHQLRGIWIKDTRAPKVSVSLFDDMIVAEAHVWGIVRELKNEGPEIKVSLLRNSTDEHASTNDFINGDQVYMSFIASVDGHIAVFSRDDSVRCLVPYRSNADGLQKIKANRRYIFFDKAGEKIEACTDREVESNTLYVLFSPEKVFSPMARKVDNEGLPVFSVDEFFDLLGQRQKKDEHLQVTTLSFLIRK